MERTSATPFTDALLDQIEKRLDGRGAKSAAARYAGISRQNLGRMLRERGVARESEVLLRLDEFSKSYKAARVTEKIERAAVRAAAADEGSPAPVELPTWIL